MKNLIKKTYLVGAFAFFSISSTFAQIQFAQGSWAETLAKAKQENKHVFVDAYAEWCGPCKMMAKNVFTNKEVGEFYNKNFVSYKFDMEKGEGPKFAQEYKIQAYPTLLYFSPKGELVHKGVGGRDNDGFVELGKISLNPETQYYTIKTKIEQGKSDNETLKNFIKSAQQVGDTEGIKTIAIKVANNTKEKDWAKPENAEIVVQAFEDEKIFKKALKMRAEFEKTMGRDAFNNAILNTFNPPFAKAVTTKDENKIKELHTKIDELFSKEDAEFIHQRLDYAYYSNTGNPEKANVARVKMEEIKAKQKK